MKPLLLALLLLPAPSREAVLADRARAQSNAREKASLPPVQPEINYSAPIILPGAGETLTIPLTGKALGADGKTYTFSGTLTLTIEAPAPPVITKLTGLRNAATALLVSSAQPGERLLLEGDLLLGGSFQRVTVGGQIAPITRTLPGTVEFTVPALPAGPATVELWWLVNNAWQSKGRLPLTISPPLPGPLPGPLPLPSGEKPRVDGSEDETGQRVERLMLNRPMAIVGSGFGEQPGKVWIGYTFLPVKRWTDTRIETQSGPGANAVHPLDLSIWTPGGGWVSGFRGPLVVER